MLLVGTVPAASADSVTFKVPRAQKSGGWSDPAYDGMKEAIEKGTEGRVLIQYFDPNQLVTFGQMLEALRAGISDIGYVIPGYYPTEFPLSQGFNLPYKWPDGVTGNRLWNALYDKYMNIDFFQMGIDMSELIDAVGKASLEKILSHGVVYSEWPQSEKDRLIAATAHIEEHWLAWTKEKGLPGKLMLDEMNALLKEWRGE